MKSLMRTACIGLLVLGAMSFTDKGHKVPAKKTHTTQTCGPDCPHPCPGDCHSGSHCKKGA